MPASEELGETVDWMAGIAELRIQDAIDEGLFDNLPGRGKPLDLTENPFKPPGMRAVNRLLRQNKVLPPWLLLEKEIEASRALALGTLARWEAAEPGLAGSPDYNTLRGAAREAYHKHLKQTNDLILKYNYSNPFAFRAPVPLLTRRRLQEFDARFGTNEKIAENEIRTGKSS